MLIKEFKLLICLSKLVYPIRDQIFNNMSLFLTILQLLIYCLEATDLYNPVVLNRICQLLIESFVIISSYRHNDKQNFIVKIT